MSCMMLTFDFCLTLGRCEDGEENVQSTIQGTVMTQFQCSAENEKFDTRNYYDARFNNILCSLSLSHIRSISFAVMPVTPNHSKSMQLRTILYHAIASRICGIPNNTMQYHY